MAFKFRRGEYLQDIVTGFKGAVLGRCDYLTSCNTYLLQPPVGEDGKYPDSLWLDETRLEYDPAHLGESLSLDRAVEQPPG